MLPFSMRDAVIASVLTSTSHTLVLSICLSNTTDHMEALVWQVTVCVYVCVRHSSWFGSLKLCGLRKEQLVSKNKRRQSFSTRMTQKEPKILFYKKLSETREYVREWESERERVNVEGCFFSVSCRGGQGWCVSPWPTVYGFDDMGEHTSQNPVAWLFCSSYGLPTKMTLIIAEITGEVCPSGAIPQGQLFQMCVIWSWSSSL